MFTKMQNTEILIAYIHKNINIQYRKKNLYKHVNI